MDPIKPGDPQSAPREAEHLSLEDDLDVPNPKTNKQDRLKSGTVIATTIKEETVEEQVHRHMREKKFDLFRYIMLAAFGVVFAITIFHPNTKPELKNAAFGIVGTIIGYCVKSIP
jgi:hypothetical protein